MAAPFPVKNSICNNLIIFYCYAGCRIFVAILNVIMLSVVVLNIFLLSAVVLNVFLLSAVVLNVFLLSVIVLMTVVECLGAFLLLPGIIFIFLSL